MTLHWLLEWIDLNVFASNKANKCIDTQGDKPKQQEESLSPEARQIYSNVNKNNRAKHVSAKQRQGQIVDISCFWNPWHGPEGVSALFALFQTSCIPSATASRECSQLCTTQLSPFATEIALSWTRHAVRGAETELIVMLTCVCLEVWYKCRCGWLLYSLIGQHQWTSTLWSFRPRGKR